VTNRRARVERVLTGVLKQAFADARSVHYQLAGNGIAAEFAGSLCERAGASRGDGLRIHAASKTALLLGEAPHADVHPLGDLYHSQLVTLIGQFEPSEGIRELAGLCGSTETLDRVLQRFFDERMPWERAAADLSEGARRELRHRLDAARFKRTRVGLVPKLGARTLGIDLQA
jgi:hypothetical protein